MSTSEQESGPSQAPDSGAQPIIVVPPAPDLTGTVLLGRYRVLRKLGAGGMGIVYLGEHATIGKKFAIKVLGNEYARRPDLVERFLQEARAASMVPQQNVVEITDFGDTPDGSVFFVMEFLDGEDLGATIKREGRLPWPRVRHLMVQVCRALEAAHAAGIVHRDMKPDNCFRIQRDSDPDFIKVLDFGIAKVQSGESSGKGLTQTGMIFGTPEYMSPEQAQGDKIDARADIYAVGVIMYQLLTGQQPFVGPNFMAVLTKHMFEVPRAPTEVAPDAAIPPEVEAIVLKAMQKDRNFRFQSMAELIEAIEQVGTGAGAVAVVHENLTRPGGGPTQFAMRQPVAPPPGSRSQGRRALVWVMAAGLISAIGVAAYLVATQGQARDDATAQAKAAEPTPAVVEPVAAPPPEPPPPDVEPTPAITRVSLFFDTNVPAQILDGRDRAILGRTDDPAGLSLPLSEQSTQLVLLADGHEELAIEVVPNRENKRYQFELGKLGGKRRPGGNKPKPATSEPVPLPEPEQPEPAPKPKKPSGDLKNPFAK